MFVFRVFLDETLKRIFIPQWGLSFFLVQLSNHKIPQCCRRRRAGPDHPGLEETDDVILNLIAAGSHPAGQLVGLLCHVEPASALV